MGILDYIRREDDLDQAIAISTIDEIQENPCLIDIEYAIWEDARQSILKGESPRRAMRKARQSLNKTNRLRALYSEGAKGPNCWNS